MAAPTKNKKPVKSVTKDDLRRLMKETRTSSATAVKRVDHPYARYNSLSQLSCSLCGSQIKTDKLWTPHVMGRTHKENVAALKQKTEAAEVPGPRPPDRGKRKASELDDEQLLKKIKEKSENGNQAQPKSILKNAPKSILKNATPQPAVVKSALALGNYASSEDESENEEEAQPPTVLHVPEPVASSSSVEDLGTGLPTDFFDAGPSKSAEPVDPIASMAEKLPEGFFDDPKLDAKVRKVEYKDKMDEEWALFQKSMKTENTVSEAIMEEDDEQKTVERNIDEIDEQLHRWTQVYDLAKKKEELMSMPPETVRKDEEEDASDIEDQEFEEFLDWRSKEAWK
ncbi:zinc finger protein 830-like isoform X2 [Lineus longissimus]|uniref:zinc finger protein 830-like isoform X2 n=1 Tax=Lineus longissimus TaxID=88925 RepID=UPI00315D16D2